jgi:hypothetical protein
MFVEEKDEKRMWGYLKGLEEIKGVMRALDFMETILSCSSSRNFASEKL